jgi:hypothetical protein
MSLPKHVKKRTMSTKEIEELGVKVKILHNTDDQSEEEIVTKATENEKEEIYVVVMNKDEELPKTGDLKGYSVNNPYKGEEGSKGEEDDEQVSSATRAVNKAMEETGLPPVPEVNIPDPTDFLDLTTVVNILEAAPQKTEINHAELGAFDFCTLQGGGGTGFEEVSLPNGMIPNNYSMLVRKDPMRAAAGTKISVYMKQVGDAMSMAHQESVQYLAPGKKEIIRRSDVQPTLVADTGLVTMVEQRRDYLANPSTYINGEPREHRQDTINSLDDLLLDLTNKKDDTGPFRFGQSIPNRTFHVLGDKRIMDVKMQVSAIDAEDMVPWDHYDKLYSALETTSRVLAKDDQDLILQRDQYYELNRTPYLPEESAEFFSHPRNASLMREVLLPQVKRAAFGAQFPLANPSSATNDMAIALNIAATNVTNDGKIAQMADPNGASDFLHNMMASLMHKSFWLNYPLSSTPLMASEFDLSILMDCLFYPLLVTPLTFSHANVRAFRNYLYLFLFRPTLGVTMPLSDDDASIDKLHELFSNPPQGINGIKLRFLRAAARYFGMVDMADVELNFDTLNAMPPGYTTILGGENGVFREVPVRDDISEYIVRSQSTMIYSRTRVGKAAYTNLNGTPATSGRKPSIGIWPLAVDFAKAFLDVCGTPEFKSQMGSVDTRTLTSMAKTLSRVCETRQQGFQHRINEMNYFLEYMGNFSYTDPKTIQSSLRYDFINGNPEYADVRPGSIYSAIALTPVTDYIDIKYPEPQSLIDGLSIYRDVSELLCTRKIIEDMYSPAALQDAVGYDRPIKTFQNTAKALLKQTFETYGTKSPTITAIKNEIERLGSEDFDNWYFPEIENEVAMGHPLFRKFGLWFNLLESMKFERGLMDGFYLTKFPSDTSLDVDDTNGGLTRRTKFKRLRQVTYVSPNTPVSENHDEETFFKKYVHTDNFRAFYDLIQDVRNGSRSIYFDIPVNFSLTPMDPNGGGLTANTFPLTWNTENASSIMPKDIKVEYWMHFDMTGDRAFDEKFMYRDDVYVLGDNPLFLTTQGRFLTPDDLLLGEKNMIIEVNFPERGKKIRPPRRYINPLLYTPH